MKGDLGGLRHALTEATAPMVAYLDTLDAFKELIAIDINGYAKEAELRFCTAKEGEYMNLPDLCKLAHKHMMDSKEIVNMLPSTICLGLVNLDCRSVRTMLSAKHKSIATALYRVLESEIKSFAELIISEFRDMFNRIIVAPTTIEGVVELRDFMAQLPVRIEALSDRIQRNEFHFGLMEAAQWQIPFDLMDMRWETARWTSNMKAEIIKQEKSLKILEQQLRKSMEEDQG